MIDYSSTTGIILKFQHALGVLMVALVVLAGCQQAAPGNAGSSAYAPADHSHEPKEKVVTLQGSGWLLCEVRSSGVSSSAWLKIAEDVPNDAPLWGWLQLAGTIAWYDLPLDVAPVVYQILRIEDNVYFSASLDENIDLFRTVSQCRSFWNATLPVGDKVKLIWWE